MPIFKGFLMFVAVCVYYVIPSSMIGNTNGLVSKLFIYHHTYLYIQTTIYSIFYKNNYPYVEKTLLLNDILYDILINRNLY